MSATNAHHHPPDESIRNKAWSFHRVLEMQKFRQNQSDRHHVLVASNFNFLHRLSRAHIGSDVRDHLAQVSDEMRSRLQNEAVSKYSNLESFLVLAQSSVSAVATRFAKR